MTTIASEQDNQVILTMSREDYLELVRIVDFGRAHIFGGEFWIKALMERVGIAIASGHAGRKVAGLKL